MFTGIIETTGSLAACKPTHAGKAFEVAAGGFAQGLEPGDSVAINGACHTVERVDGERFGFTSVGETLKKTNLDDLRTGDRVNLERAATPQTMLSGHFVQGHVDGVGLVESFETVGRDRLLEVRVPRDIFDLVVPKGSIAIDGVSLTVIERHADDVVTITIVPFTLEHTIVDGYTKGTRVNVEADVIGKYVMEYVNRIHIEKSQR